MKSSPEHHQFQLAEIISPKGSHDVGDKKENKQFNLRNLPWGVQKPHNYKPSVLFGSGSRRGCKDTGCWGLREKDVSAEVYRQ